MAVSQSVSLPWDLLEDSLAEPQARTKLGHHAATMPHPSRDPEVCLNIRRTEIAGTLSKYAIPVAAGEVKRFISHSGCFSIGSGEGTSYSWNFNSDLYKEK